MTCIALEDASRQLGERQILDRVSLAIDDGDRVGLVGVNGSGKSTMLRILAGLEDLDDGKRTLRRGLQLGMLEQQPVLPADARARDVVRAGMAGRDTVVAELDRVHERLAATDLDEAEMTRLLDRQAELDEKLERFGGHDVEHRVEAVLDGLGITDADRICGAMSGGEQRRVALARLLLGGPDLLLLDEPTNHLDTDAVEWLEDWLLQCRLPYLLVTHDRYLLDRTVDRIVELDAAKLHDYAGNYSAYVVERAERLARAAAAEATRLNLLRRETAWIRRGPPARTTKAKARIDRFHALLDDAPDDVPLELEFRIPTGPRLGERVLRLAGLVVERAGRTLIRGLDLEVGRGEVLGIVGRNGSGKSTLLSVLTGQRPPDGGALEIGQTVRFAGIDQHRSDLDPAQTVFEAVGGGNDHVVVDGRPMRIESFLEGMQFPADRRRTRLGDLSGGERHRVAIAKLLCEDGNVLVLDEPTNDLDLPTLRVLEEALLAFPGTVLVVSHDRWFLDRVADRVLLLGGDGTTHVHVGPLADLLERRRQEVAAAARAAVAGKERERAKAATPAATAAGKKLTWAEQKELEKLPARIEALEAELGGLDEQLADPALYGDGADRTAAAALADRRAALAADLETVYARWTDLEDRQGS